MHRIGRTGRAGRTGIAVTLVDWDELPQWTMIDKAPKPGLSRSRRDVLQLAAPLRRTRHPDGRHRVRRTATKAKRPPRTDRSRDDRSARTAPRAATARQRRVSERAAFGPAPHRNRDRQRPAAARPRPDTSKAARRAPRATQANGAPSTSAEAVTAEPGRQLVAAVVVARVSLRTPPPAHRSTPAESGAMVRPERRTRADIIAAVAIAAVVAVVAAVIWWTSDARATESRPAGAAAKSVVPARVVPNTLKELWTAASPHTTTPVVAGGVVVTGDGRTVSGRDPITGEALWTFARDRELCGVSWRLSLRGRRLSRRPGLRAGQHHRRGHRPTRTDPQRLRRQACRAVVGRHHRARRRLDPAGAVALRHGPHHRLRRGRRPGEAGPDRRRQGLHSAVVRRQFDGRVGAAGLPGQGRPAVDLAAAGQRGRRTRTA